MVCLGFHLTYEVGSKFCLSITLSIKSQDQNQVLTLFWQILFHLKLKFLSIACKAFSDASSDSK